MIIQNIAELDCISPLSVDVGKDVLEIMYLKLFKSFADGGGAAFSFFMKSNQNTIYTSYIRDRFWFIFSVQFKKMY